MNIYLYAAGIGVVSAVLYWLLFGRKKTLSITPYVPSSHVVATDALDAATKAVETAHAVSKEDPVPHVLEASHALADAAQKTLEVVGHAVESAKKELEDKHGD